MVPNTQSMTRWSQELEDELAALLKDWLKQQGRTQSDLRRSLRATSTRMPALMEVLEREHVLGGMPRLAARLCAIEAEWAADPGAIAHEDSDASAPQSNADPFGQLDLLLREIRDDCTG
jgi:hypothetical protein